MFGGSKAQDGRANLRSSQRLGSFLREADEVDKQWDRHREIARYITKGYGNVEIAQIMGITPQTVSDVRRSPVIAEHVAMLHRERDAEFAAQDDEIRELVPQCIQVLRELTDEESRAGVAPELRFKAAAHVLGIVGHSPAKKAEQSGPTHLTLQQINVITERAKELALTAGQL